MKDSVTIDIYTDGASKGNPGNGGFGYVIQMGGYVYKYAQGEINTTNNRMELMAVIMGMEALKRPCDVEIYSDSKYVIDAFNQHWIDNWQQKGWKTSTKKPVLNIDLWKRLLKAKEPHQVTFTWVKGHVGHPENERCDKLATTAADGEGLLDDIVQEVL